MDEHTTLGMISDALLDLAHSSMEAYTNYHKYVLTVCVQYLVLAIVRGFLTEGLDESFEKLGLLFLTEGLKYLFSCYTLEISKQICQCSRNLIENAADTKGKYRVVIVTERVNGTPSGKKGQRWMYLLSRTQTGAWLTDGGSARSAAQ
eukprot:1375253-Amorphochlora_amoeboformis.AAC.1